MKIKTICGFKNVFGIECAGCGGTRMFMALLQWDFYQAFRYNPFIFCLLIIGLIYSIYLVVMKVLKKKIYVPSIKWLFVLLILSLIFMILRNIPGLEFLLPTDV